MRLTSGAQAIGAQINRDVRHRLAVVVHAGPPGWAIAVIRCDTGEIIAWDGWYTEQLSAEQRRPLSNLDFARWDDMPSKLLVEANGPWLADQLASWLMPTYSVAYNAAELVGTHFGSTDINARRNFAAAPAVAYLPVTDHAVFLARLSEMGERYPALAQDALEEMRTLFEGA
ncbi:hypothetical protein Q6348_08420 [Isoptericola sp. b441]|uniref:Uncharacterized protein n=1 Tax=Actinotalea lenta TaxID=3064654 RepID=A0ABT9DDW6_9CELL|nr:hypothetical protein [Isoptericola sp. b441]MDO8107217.1 hypothetical protein [Isoptericola sp. b441]